MYHERKPSKEVDANFEALQKVLPALLPYEADRWALMRHGECFDFYDTLRDAETAGRAMYAVAEDEAISLDPGQTVMEAPSRLVPAARELIAGHEEVA